MNMNMMPLAIAPSNLLLRADLNSSTPQPPRTLPSILQNKRRILESELGSLQPHQLQTRLTSFPPSPAPHSLLRTVVERSLKRDITIIVEVARSSPAEAPEMLATRCKNYLKWGADAIAVRTDEEVSSDGVADLRAVCNSLNVPIIRADWILHPLQVAEVREAGGAALTTVYSILGKGLPALSKYALSLGLDPIVEVVNLNELVAVSDLGISFYGINISVGLSLSVPGLRQDVAKSLLGQMPFGVYTIVGIQSEVEALEMKVAGADALYLRHEFWQAIITPESKGEDEAFLKRLRDTLSND